MSQFDWLCLDLVVPQTCTVLTELTLKPNEHFKNNELSLIMIYILANTLQINKNYISHIHALYLTTIPEAFSYLTQFRYLLRAEIKK